MTELATYLRDHGITQAAFAEQIGMTQSAVSRLCAKKVGISIEAAVKIEQATGGKVRPSSWLTAPQEGTAA